MAYRLDPTRDTTEEVVRLLNEQLGKGIRVLRAEDNPSPETIRDVRKRIKKGRAVLRLARGMYRKPVLVGLHGRLRSVAHVLATQRDADANAETAAALHEPAAATHDPAAMTAVARLTGTLRSRASEVAASGSLSHPARLRLADELEVALAELAAEPAGATGWPGLSVGFRATYGQGRRRFGALGPASTAEDLHEWRKRVKDVWYQLRLLRGMWPLGMQPYVDTADRLAKLLGADHDLSELTSTAGEVLDGEALGAVLGLVHSVRYDARSEIAALGFRLYADEPAPWTARHGLWFRAGPPPPPPPVPVPEAAPSKPAPSQAAS